MKIEIEFEDVERLKREITLLKEENVKLNNDLKKLSPDEIKKSGVELAEKMMKSAIRRIFKEVGIEGEFNTWQGTNFATLVHYLGMDWPENERLEVNVGATFTNKFKEAFLNFYIKDK